ncbi:GerAB/ArcD/ProY family transporter [Desulfosporosinus sp. SYSU MS00001]|uniref:GerAB/ArcD/ProY family transporter n=1 Tax=Desulfosporosinus sp. SYSU MS00001 TaxID=3416284 RepID=UPI003CEC8FE8
MERISAHQFMTLGASVLMGGTFLLIATFVTEAGGRDGWMSIMPAFALTIPYGIMILSLSARYPEKNLLDISGIIFGKWTEKIIGSLYIVISGYYGGLLLAFIGIIYEQSIMPLVPRWVLYLGGLLLVFYLASTGIEVFARFSEVLLPVIVVALVFNIVLTFPRIEQNELLPFFENGVKPLLWGALKVIPFPMVYSMFLAGIITFLPQNNQQEISQFKTGIWRAAFLVGILNTIVVLSQILVFGPRETIRLSFGILELGKMVEISRTVAGVESLFMGVWLGALVIKCCAFFYMTTWGLETVLNLKGIKWRLLLGATFLGIAFGVKKGFYLSTKLSFVESYLIFPFVFVWIPILWITSHWKVKLNTPNKTS